MTLDLGMWPLASLTYEGTPFASLTKFDSNQTFKEDQNNENQHFPYTTQKESTIPIAPYCFSSQGGEKRKIFMQKGVKFAPIASKEAIIKASVATCIDLEYNKGL